MATTEIPPFEEELGKILTVHEMNHTIYVCMGWMEGGKPRKQKRTHAFKNPQKWTFKELRALCSLFDSKGLHGVVEVMNLVEEFDLGREGLTWAEGRKLEQEVIKEVEDPYNH